MFTIFDIIASLRPLSGDINEIWGGRLLKGCRGFLSENVIQVPLSSQQMDFAGLQKKLATKIRICQTVQSFPNEATNITGRDYYLNFFTKDISEITAEC